MKKYSKIASTYISINPVKHQELIQGAIIELFGLVELFTGADSLCVLITSRKTVII